ncbi:hypothetical protein GCM10023215_67110 [Pseudonocardia yuanmonensis]|uniref:Uncharacterized protein n=1 Tax=Pseudonocardia yuanmonensis TaxID=1095914 RepID=A0ABP8XVR5_9PSEU
MLLSCSAISRNSPGRSGGGAGWSSGPTTRSRSVGGIGGSPELALGPEVGLALCFGLGFTLARLVALVGLLAGRALVCELVVD